MNLHPDTVAAVRDVSAGNASSERHDDKNSMPIAVPRRRFTVSIIERDAMLRSLIATWVDSLDAYTVGAVSNEDHALRDEATAHHIVVLGTHWPSSEEHFERVHSLSSRGYAVVVLALAEDPGLAAASFAARAAAFVTREHSPDALAAVLLAVSRGARGVLSESAGVRDQRSARPVLSRRQQQVAILYSTGLPMKTVARKLGISEATALEHLRRFKSAYDSVGRAAPTKHAIAARVKEDRIYASGEQLLVS